MGIYDPFSGKHFLDFWVEKRQIFLSDLWHLELIDEKKKKQTRKEKRGKEKTKAERACIAASRNEGSPLSNTLRRG